MVAKILRLWVIGLLFFVSESRLYANDLEIELPINHTLVPPHNEAIVKQQQAHQYREDQHLTDYSLNDDRVLNYCAFACGRSLFFSRDCYISDTELKEKPSDCHCIGCLAPSSLLSCGFGTTAIWNFVDLFRYPYTPSLPNCCTFISWTPTIATGGLCLVCTGYALTGRAIYFCADCMDKEEFTTDFKRGLYCAKEDCCSCTGIYIGFKNFWNPCCGKSYRRL